MAMVVVIDFLMRLEERSLPTPEIRGSKPNIAKIYKFICQLHLIAKTKMKKKQAEIGSFKK